jgi:streptogramin lyase
VINPTTHAITEFSSGLNPGAALQQGLVAGPDGNLWFTDGGTTPAIG